MKRILLTIICSAMAVAIVSAQVTFKIEAPRQTEVGQQIRVKYVANTTDAKGIQVDDFNGFEVAYGPSTSRSSSFTMINGKTTQSSTLTFTYVLVATKEGTYKLPEATIEVDGKSIKSNSASIEVLPASSQGNSSNQNGSQSGQSAQNGHGGNTSGANSQNIGTKDLYMTVTANKTKVYEQEAVLLTYKLYTLVNIQQIAGEIPQLDGFHVQELNAKQQMSLKYERVNGRNYGTAIWRQYVLFPQKSGKLKIPSVTFDTQIEVQNTSMDPFDVFFGGGSLMQVVRKSITAPSCELEVMPLPSPKPDNFTGAVGHFSISGNLTPEELKTNDAATLRLVVSGYGNMKLMTAPKVKFPQDFELYAPKETDKTTYTSEGAKGNKVYDYVAVPRHGGTFHIPAVEFCYFDLVTKSYKTLTTDSLTIKVAKGKGHAANAPTEQEDLKVLGNDIRYIKMGGINVDMPGDLVYGSRTYWLTYPALLLMAICGLLIGKRIMRSGQGRQKASKVASKRLRNAEKLMKQGQADLFYEEVMRALLGYAADKLNISMSQLTKDNVAEAMSEHKVPEDLVKNYMDVMAECEFARFAPGEPAAKMEKMYSDASETINKLEASIKKNKQ
ncbi:MAG: BatD family protein [Bacteroidaceae bacterium]